MSIKYFSKHYEKTILVEAKPDEVFTYADDHKNFSAHMSQSSWMMGGGSMKTETDEGEGKKLGSHIRMKGKVLGFKLFLDEVVVEHESPRRKAWETVGEVKLLVIDHYKLGFEIIPKGRKTELRVYIDYNYPKSSIAGIPARLLGDFYAKWCVMQMINTTKKHFTSYPASS